MIKTSASDWCFVCVAFVALIVFVAFCVLVFVAVCVSNAESIFIRVGFFADTSCGCAVFGSLAFAALGFVLESNLLESILLESVASDSGKLDSDMFALGARIAFVVLMQTTSKAQ